MSHRPITPQCTRRLETEDTIQGTVGRTRPMQVGALGRDILLSRLDQSSVACHVLVEFTHQPSGRFSLSSLDEMHVALLIYASAKMQYH